ncbi:Adenylate and Guanylate cyclase catalytic domain containing protein [Trichomonas vaginalis G3]|uniref:Adenylate and Guanylate cyclase catalytic domain containing protein n=1 Tax=Trichomonas vaginalis (strain ATCC PRA-98 / G3) TaxID=412133 RepID=A2DKP6_TRIV3|nr:guanylate cyclase protein [Trichomonas vaginalis G3]EAY19029.1 Adenylate and Guanylate cyclase catalytic domain containing protein [Trichomonas vaginalis G3]KAI5521177.1 guanylate cyclase protein [Trichomonas vaginalis G3]|eukprot:XP_001580015.1 Adenylate and Guanylate cyclase catalytic domain containing protein [Trichomonas vaginalis G3]
MEEAQTTTSMVSSEIATSSLSRYEGLIDVPLSDKIIDSLTALFNYFDIYAPKMEFVYAIVTFFRFFQLLGGAFMAANLDSFEPGTLTFNAMSIITVLFHVVPVQYRRGNGHIVLLVVNGLLLIFGIYLILPAFLYKKTSKVPSASTKILSIFMAIGPYLLVPISAQYAGQMLSGNISGTLEINAINICSEIISLICISLWMWIIIKAYSIALVFRQLSFASIEGTPQTKLLITTTVVTFASALTTNLTTYPSSAMMIISMLCYIYCCTTCFNCGSFIKKMHTVMVLGGSILGFFLCGANLYTIFAHAPWNEIFFPIVIIAGVIIFFAVSFYIKRRQTRELRLLDEIDDTQDISILKRASHFKQILSTGFIFAHPICVSFKIFKMAASKWSDDLDVWSLYAKFFAIYPEQVTALAFVAQNVSTMKAKDRTLQSIILSSTGYIIKTRETKFTQQLKGKISKLAKMFNKTKAGLRNIWDLTLQGNINEMNVAIKRTQESVNECEVEMAHLLMQYPNNRYVARQYTLFLNEIKGDPLQAKASFENLTKLQRGVSVSEDTIHDLGIMAFPNIPEVCSDIEGQSKTVVDGKSMGIDDVIMDDNLNLEAIQSISKQIDNHVIPSISYIYTTTIVCFICLILIPLITMAVAYRFYAREVEKPVKFMEGIAHTRNIIAMLTAYIGRFLFQKLDDPKNPGSPIEGPLNLIKNLDLSATGGSSDTTEVLEYIASTVADANTQMSSVRSYMPGNSYIEKVRELLFTNSVNFSFYLNNTYADSTMTSVVEISYMVSNHVGKLTDLDEITPKIACGPDSLTSRNNNQLSLLAMNDALLTMIEFLKHINTQYQLYFTIVIIVMICINVIVYPIVYFIQVSKLRKNRQEILFILTTLLKTVISSISASFNKLKDGNDRSSTTDSSDGETNRQEDSIIKLFSSISDGSAKASAEISNLFCFLFLMALGCVGYYVSMDAFRTSMTNLVYNSHHINYLFGSATYLYSVMASLFKISLAMYDDVFKTSIISLSDEVTNVGERIPMLVSYFQMIRLGGSDIREVPFPEMKIYIDQASAALICSDPLTPPQTLMQSTHCLSAAQQLYVATTLMHKYYGLMLLDQPMYPDPSEISMQQLWQIGPVELYTTFFYPAGNQIVGIIVGGLDDREKTQIIWTAILIIASFIFSLIIILSAKKEDTLLKFTLRLFLRCPPMTVLNNSRITRLLSGNYNSMVDESADKGLWFTNEVVNKLNDVVIVCQEETGKIITVNAAFEELFGIKQAEIENTPAKEFFVPSRFTCSENLEKIFTTTLNMIYKKSETEKVYLEFSSTSVSGRKIFSGRDQTQNVMHEKLIADEKKKSDSMLASILPPMLVPRVQAGEKNISFSVQSATVLFLDVVEFTPWCGSHDAQYVMRMLNIMFKEFDAITNAHKTMTKIKCIGDCYMAACGIFDEVNQPAVHAKEVVDFGTLVIKKLLEIDENENENLRIRVGINTGGPIVAGVIGTEKPTFEILGPAINIAHEMENKGVPMKVHISRPVYELIYGQQFDIKERGEIDVKGGKMFTYLVEP